MAAQSEPFLQTKPGQGTCFPYYICRPFSGQPIGSKISGSSTSVSTAVPCAGNPDGPELCLLQATLCLQQAALKLQALQGSNSEVVPSAGKPSQTLCWASCLAPGWSLSKSSSRLSIMWLITTALLDPSSAGATVPDGTSIPVAGGGLPGHSTFIGLLLLLLLLLLLSPGARLW